MHNAVTIDGYNAVRLFTQPSSFAGVARTDRLCSCNTNETPSQMHTIALRQQSTNDHPIAPLTVPISTQAANAPLAVFASSLDGVFTGQLLIRRTWRYNRGCRGIGSRKLGSVHHDLAVSIAHMKRRHSGCLMLETMAAGQTGHVSHSTAWSMNHERSEGH